MLQRHLDAIISLLEDARKSVDPESNQGPSDLQSDALPTELSTVGKDQLTQGWAVPTE